MNHTDDTNGTNDKNDKELSELCEGGPRPRLNHADEAYFCDRRWKWHFKNGHIYKTRCRQLRDSNYTRYMHRIVAIRTAFPRVLTGKISSISRVQGDYRRDNLFYKTITYEEFLTRNKILKDNGQPTEIDEYGVFFTPEELQAIICRINRQVALDTLGTLNTLELHQGPTFENREQKTIWTIGHSTKSFEEFVSMLQSCSITCLIDVRSLPGSRRYPHFNKEVLPESLGSYGIKYMHFDNLGGRRRSKPGSQNTVWKNVSFRSYADYMETMGFGIGIYELESIAVAERVAYMCSEAVWWRCHRSMISDCLKSRLWRVMHIMSTTKETEHPYTGPASIVDGNLVYGPKK